MARVSVVDPFVSGSTNGMMAAADGASLNVSDGSSQHQRTHNVSRRMSERQVVGAVPFGGAETNACRG